MQEEQTECAWHCMALLDGTYDTIRDLSEMYATGSLMTRAFSELELHYSSFIFLAELEASGAKRLP